VSAALVPAGGIGRLAPGVDVVINPLNERLVLANEQTIPAGTVQLGAVIAAEIPPLFDREL
jgi:hypothetical protein